MDDAELEYSFLFQFFGIQFGVCQYKHEFSEPTVLNVIAPFHTSVYAKVFIGKRYLHLFLMFVLNNFIIFP